LDFFAIRIYLIYFVRFRKSSFGFLKSDKRRRIPSIKTLSWYRCRLACPLGPTAFDTETRIEHIIGTNRFSTAMRALVLDGYTDEPACLGVPPFVSPYARLAFGALTSAGAEVDYVTIDQWRSRTLSFDRYDLLAVIRNIAVPGKYLRGMPASDRELLEIASSFNGRSAASLGVNPDKAPKDLREAFDHVAAGDFDASMNDLVTKGEFVQRRRTYEEWNAWLIRGAGVCPHHPDYGGQLIAEVQMYRGCVRYISGGCKFCIEPLFGDVQFRRPSDILAEVEALANAGVRNFRLGAQSCVFCYMSDETGKSETPTPNPDVVSRLLKGIQAIARPEVLHLDNANPAVIAEHPKESREITKAIAEYCTSGNVLAFGLESADPRVANANNLNATAEQTLEAIRLVNEIGVARGPTGLPRVLPGINFVCGLDGETKETYRLNLDFLREVVNQGLMLRRINIRQVIPSRGEFPGVKSKADFTKFKRAVREEIDGPLLEKLVPDRIILRSVYAEVKEGGRTFGRQVGTYPLLVSISYSVDIGRRIDVAVTGRGFRSVNGVEHPTDANSATLSMLEAIPGIGKRRAMSIVRKRPFATEAELWKLFDEPNALASAQFHLALRNVVEKQ
jgi:radical SAM superfamily enzyme with C-terminal helix-hairpin-helix motif